MQRMTKRLPNGVIHADFIAKQKESVMGRLAAIEDILGDKYDLDRLHELVQADRERRRVVTPPDPATESEYEIICRPLNPEYIHLRKVFEK